MLNENQFKKKEQREFSIFFGGSMFLVSILGIVGMIFFADKAKEQERRADINFHNYMKLKADSATATKNIYFKNTKKWRLK